MLDAVGSCACFGVSIPYDDTIRYPIRYVPQPSNPPSVALPASALRLPWPLYLPGEQSSWTLLASYYLSIRNGLDHLTPLRMVYLGRPVSHILMCLRDTASGDRVKPGPLYRRDIPILLSPRSRFTYVLKSAPSL